MHEHSTQPVTSSESLPGALDAPWGAPALSGEQAAVRQALTRWNEDHDDGRALAPMYVGALFAWHHGSANPERGAQAAHSLRELIEKLGFRPDGTLGQQVNPVLNAWREAREQSTCRSGGSWSGPVDVHVVAIIEAVGRLATWADAHLADWDKKLQRWVGTHSRQRDRMSDDEIRDDAHTLFILRQVFLAVCHHGTPRGLTLQEAMRSLDQMLLRHLEP